MVLEEPGVDVHSHSDAGCGATCEMGAAALPSAVWSSHRFHLDQGGVGNTEGSPQRETENNLEHFQKYELPEGPCPEGCRLGPTHEHILRSVSPEHRGRGPWPAQQRRGASS